LLADHLKERLNPKWRTQTISLQERGKFKRVIVVTGTPGVGKTIVSEKLAARLGAVHIDIGALVRKEKIIDGYDEKRQTLIADTEKLARRARQIIAETRKTVIIDGHYATDIVPENQLTKVFVLRCHPKQLKQRMEERGFQGMKLKENLAAEILDVCLVDAVTRVGAAKVCEINTTDKAVDDTTSEIMSILRNRKHCAIGIVDWLGQLELEGSLEHYLQGF